MIATENGTVKFFDLSYEHRFFVGKAIQHRAHMARLIAWADKVQAADHIGRLMGLR